MGKKSDLEQLKEIFNQFDADTIAFAMNELQEGAHCCKSYKDFDDPGPEVEVGAESRVAIEDMAYLERIIAESNLLPVHYLEEGAAVQRAVARVTLKESYSGLPAGSGWATGFLVSPSLFMTNNHVIPSESFARKVGMQFNYQLDYNGVPQTVEEYSTNPDDVFYTNASLDFTIVRLNRRCRWIFKKLLSEHEDLYYGEQDVNYPASEYTPDPFGPLPPRPIPPLPRAPFQPIPRPIPFPRLGRVCTTPGQKWGYIRLNNSISFATRQHVNIIQHPSGRRKEVALQKNTITNIYTNRLRYETDTEPGSSGSPVFNNAWDLITIHHAGGERRNGVWINNEGMRMDKIIANLRSHYGGTTTGSQILSELGI